MKATKTQKLISALFRSPLTAAQIRTRFGVANPTAQISYVRSLGYRVDLVDSGKVKKYSIG